jgi:uncharacterized protein
MTTPTPRKPLATCPQCGKPFEWDRANQFRPFCSERCKLIDLGKWATEDYRIPDAAANPPTDQ